MGRGRGRLGAYCPSAYGHRYANGLPRALDNAATAALMTAVADTKSLAAAACARLK